MDIIKAFDHTHYVGHGYLTDPTIMGFTVALFVLFIIMVVSWWKLFTKAGEKGWKAIIPFYDFYTACKLYSKKAYFWIIIITWLLDIIFNELYMWVHIVPRPICMLACFITTLIWIIFGALFHIHTAKSYGKSTGYGIFMLIFPVIAYPILAFGTSKFVGNPTKEQKQK